MSRRLFSSILCFFICLFTLGFCKPKEKPEVSTDFKNITVSEARKLLNEDQKIIFLDVRTPEETAEGIIPNAMTVDYRNDNFRDMVSELNKSDSYVVYCRSGRRSESASKIMKELGFEDVMNMEGGYLAWTEDE